MKKRTFIKGVAAAALMAGATALSTFSASAQEVTLKLHQFLPPQANVPKQVLDVWADNVEKDSGGKIKVEPLLSAVAGLADGGEWFHRLHKNTEGLLKVVLKP